MIVECKMCEALVDAVEIAEYAHNDANIYKFLKCPRCESPFLIDHDMLFDEPIRLYPVQENVVSVNLPRTLRVSYREAFACFKAKAYTASAIMCRKALEGICAEHGTAGHNLYSSLKELKEKGVIESRLYEWADALRISGNEAVHDVNVTVSAEDARDILEFTKALLEYVFTFRDKFEEFKKRRADRAKGVGK